MEVSPFGYEQLGYEPNFEIALNMSLEQLRFYCTSNELFRSICSDQEFWNQRLQNEYPDTIQYKPINMTYGQYYILLAEGKIKFITIVYNNKIIGDIPVFPSDTRSNVFRRLIDIMSSIYPDFDPNTTSVTLMYFTKTEDPHLEIATVHSRGGLVRQLEFEIPAISNGKLFDDIISMRKSGFRGPAFKLQRNV
jgi:hypothetical protein